MVGTLPSHKGHRTQQDPNHNESSPTPNGDQIPSGNQTNANARLLASSRLTSANWTDTDGHLHQFVFFQDVFSAIIARKWESQNKTWVTSNLTSALTLSGSPLRPMSPSTPLASIASKFNSSAEVHLYFLTENNGISGVAVHDLVNRPDTWQLDALGITTWPGSSLAAAWNRCWDFQCAGSYVVAYQRPDDAAIAVANSSDFSLSAVAVDLFGVAQGSSIGLIAEDVRLTMYTEFLVSQISGRIQKTAYTQGSWNILEQRFYLPPPSARVQLVIGALPNNDGIIFLALLPNGTLTGEFFRGSYVPIPIIRFQGGPPDVNFSAIATGEDAAFYGISNDTILQYSINDSDPSTFDFVETVYP
ncbi:hypothetical protein F4782DRAFT_498721 [Xylaria castorea]|nr:hypothetical protein F4782DRAFT_498721 [Xylaria castorea]